MTKQITEQTRKKLLDSYWELYKEEDFNKITISAICKKANYDRTTFYRYFFDIYDLSNQFEDEIISTIRNNINLKDKVTQENKISYIGFKGFVSKYGEYIVTFKEKGNILFYNKFKEFVKNDVYSYFIINTNDEVQKEFIFEFILSSLLNSFTYWYRHQDTMSLESFVDFTNKILTNGLNFIINKKES